ncbi:MAG: caspase family protein [Deltaproteobacteria bacterium]|nr:caspase family protein [Deltaproteobacteria bacterium]
MRSTIFIVSCSLLVCLLASAGQARELPPPGAQWSFGLVIGCNSTDDPEEVPLRYADDDSVQNARLLTQLGGPGGVILLTRLDAESKELFPQLSPAAPTKKAIGQAMRRLNKLMEYARQNGGVPVLYVFYSGHGDVENNEGYLRLEDGKFWRSDLLKLLKESRASVNHVIIDACKSYFMVYNRGAGGQRRPVSGNLLAGEDKLPDNTGVFLSTSSAADSHEWEAFGGGLFSHEVRSALRGAADLNRDGTITYQEAASFVWTANSAVVNRRYRPVFYSRPPSSSAAGQDVLAKLDQAVGGWLKIGLEFSRHIYIEDQNGLRIADLFPGDEQSVALLLPAQRPLFVRQTKTDQEYELRTSGEEIQLSELTPSKMTVTRRGAEHVAFGKLFTRPFDQSALATYQNHIAQMSETFKIRPQYTWLRRSLGLAAIGLGAVGGTCSSLAAWERKKVDSYTTGTERNDINQRINRLNTAAITMYSLAGVALASYLIWTFWPEDDVQLQFIPSDQPQLNLSLRF